MKTLLTWVAKLLGFFVFCLAFWKWGEVTAQKKEAEDERDAAIKTSQDFEDINSEPYVDNPADFLCYDNSEYPKIPEDDQGSGKDA